MAYSTRTSWHILFVFPCVLIITAPLRAFKDVLYPNFDPQEWSLIRSQGIMNRIFANHCFELFLLTFILLNIFKVWLVMFKAPLLPVTASVEESERGNAPTNESDLCLYRQIQNPESQTNTEKRYYYIQLLKLVVIYGSISACIVWFFGPSIYDRIHRDTGGHCVKHPEIPFYRICKDAGYNYKGGFKSSGHSLITTTLASCLAFETLSMWNWLVFVNSLNGLSTAVIRAGKIVLFCCLFLYVTWLSVFTVTCLFYHTLGERVVGTATACAVVYCTFLRYKL